MSNLGRSYKCLKMFAYLNDDSDIEEDNNVIKDQNDEVEAENGED